MTVQVGVGSQSVVGDRGASLRGLHGELRNGGPSYLILLVWGLRGTSYKMGEHEEQIEGLVCGGFMVS